MDRVPHIVRERKKSKTLGEPKVISREAYEALELDSRLELIRALIPIGLSYIQEELEREVINLAGPRYSRKAGEVVFRRHGTNPGSVRLAGRNVPIRVPRVRDSQGEVPLDSYEDLHRGGEVDEDLFRRVLYGVSCRNYEQAAGEVPGSDWFFEFVGVTRLREGQRQAAAGVSGAGPFQAGCGGLVPGWEEFRRGRDGDRSGRITGREQAPSRWAKEGIQGSGADPALPVAQA